MTPIETVENLYSIIPLKELRRTPNVYFDAIPLENFQNIGSIDRVIHESKATSPGPVGEVARPWYMHTHQDDNLVVMSGTRFVDIYTPAHGKVEHFEVTPNSIKKNGTLIYEGPAFLVWPKGVFHRVRSDKEGSSSFNIAVHYDGLDMRTNFSIYSLNEENGEYKVIREGHLDQPSTK